jgi:hypothetical protein
MRACAVAALGDGEQVRQASNRGRGVSAAGSQHRRGGFKGQNAGGDGRRQVRRGISFERDSVGLQGAERWGVVHAERTEPRVGGGGNRQSQGQRGRSAVGAVAWLDENSGVLPC